MEGAARRPAVTSVSPAALRWFSWYNRRYVARHVSDVRIAGLDEPTLIACRERAPLVVYLTHASWWDPLIGALLARGPLVERRHRAVIDARALERYALLSRLGFIGLDRDGAAGGRAFLRTLDGLANEPSMTLWLTPQGRFVDPRVRPIRLAPGLAHIARRWPNARFLPLAIEYPMRGERLPAARLRVGEPESFDAIEGGASLDAAGLTAHFEARLTEAADRLAEDVMHERDDDYTTLLDGRHGVSAIYDLGRRVKARLTGRRFESRHGGNLPIA